MSTGRGYNDIIDGTIKSDGHELAHARENELIAASPKIDRKITKILCAKGSRCKALVVVDTIPKLGGHVQRPIITACKLITTGVLKGNEQLSD